MTPPTQPSLREQFAELSWIERTCLHAIIVGLSAITGGVIGLVLHAVDSGAAIGAVSGTIFATFLVFAIPRRTP
jgi:hypothetical protein